MQRTHFFQPALAAAILTTALALAGCAEARRMNSQSVLIDAAHPAKSMFHVTTVADPFGKAGAAGNETPKVLKGGPLSDKEPYANKLTFVTDKGFFAMPKSGGAELHLRLAVRKIRDVRVEVTARDPKGSKKFNATLPAEGGWQELVLVLDSAVFQPGSTIFDITVFQVGKDHAAEIYVGEIKLRTE
jgi:hypothetical protein